jgi:hypothetical protein
MLQTTSFCFLLVKMSIRCHCELSSTQTPSIRLRKLTSLKVNCLCDTYRYVSLIKQLKLLTSQTHIPEDLATLLHPVISAILRDIRVIWNTPKLVSTASFTDLIRTLQANHLSHMSQLTEHISSTVKPKTKDGLSNHAISQDFCEQVYTIGLSSHLLMAEFLSLQESRLNLVQEVSPFKAALNAAQCARTYAKDSLGITPPEIQITNATDVSHL